jgi:hypothetical protein
MKADASQAHLEKHVRIHFPSAATVRNSKGKAEHAQTICLQSKYYDSPSFPKALMRNHVPLRNGLLSHNKIILGRGLRQSEDGGSKPVAWVYVGSANLTESALGKVVMDRASKKPKVNCRNWETGVLMRIPIADDLESKGKQQQKPPAYDVFQGSLEFPCRIPGEEYKKHDRPWFFMG